jgi:hypothetical protein
LGRPSRLPNHRIAGIAAGIAMVTSQMSAGFIARMAGGTA